MTDEHGNEENRRWQADAQTGDATPRTGEEKYGSTGPDVSQGRRTTSSADQDAASRPPINENSDDGHPGHEDRGGDRPAAGHSHTGQAPGSPITVPGWDEYFLGIAAAVSARAKCTRRRVGAVLVHEHRIIATGYNGAAPGRPDCLEGACPRGRLGYAEVPAFSDYDVPGAPGFCIAIHAEVNALLFATRDTAGCTAYVTDQPCPGCRKALAAAGVVRAVWPDGQFDADELVDWGR